MAREPMWRRYARWWGTDVAADVDAELQHHLDLLTRDYMDRGHAPDRARALAVKRLGDLARVRSICVREGQWWEQTKARRWMWTQLAQDVRFAWRTLAKAPSTTAIAVATVALAIGATTTIFSVVYGVLIRPLPYPDPDRLVQVRLSVAFQRETAAMSPADFVAWRRARESFDDIAVYSVNPFNVTGAGTPEAVVGGWASARLFALLGARAALGRIFLPDDDRPGAEAIVVLTDGFWRRQFGADPAVLGRSITVTGVPSTIVGVLAPDFRFPQPDVALWRNLRLNPERRGPFYLTGLGRLRPGRTMAQAREELRSVSSAIRRQYPGSDDWTFDVRPLHEATVGGVRQVLWLLFGAVILLLLIAVVNVANLLLARAAAREHEIAVRAALGAGTGRIVRQLLTESVVLAALGGTAGVWLAIAGTRLVVALGGDRIPRSADISVDLGVLGFSAAMALGGGLLFGLAPALQVFRSDAARTLQAGRRAAGSGHHRRSQAALVVVQVALATVLMVCASLLTRSLLQLTRHDPGFRTDRLLTFYLDLPWARYSTDESMTRFYDRLLPRLRMLPSVESVGAAMSLPPHRLILSDAFIIEGQPAPRGYTPPVAPFIIVSGDYFETVGIPLLRGRAFHSGDRPKSEPVVIISRTLARQHFGDVDPIGRRMRIGPERENWPWLTIVGIVGDVPYTGLDAEPPPAYYLPASQNAWGDYYVAIRTAADPEALASAVRAAVWSIDPELPVAQVSTMDEHVRDALGPQTFRTTLVGLFGVLGFVLAAVGIYGVMAYTVGQRTRELGIRAALGANPAQNLRLVLSNGLRLATIGTVIGIAASLAATGALSGLLFGVSPRDPAVFGGVIGLTLGMALAASFTPAWRAMRVDPIAVLRQE